MKIQYWTKTDVNENGSMGIPADPTLGTVCTTPKMDTSGNHHLQTRSTQRDGLWLMVMTGRLEDGTCHGITLYFDDEAEMRAFSRVRVATGFMS
jgi:hypothetical protein